VLGTHHLLARARADGATRFLFVSSGAVHGVLPPGTVVREDVYGAVDPLDIRSSYAESKRMGETMCRSWHAQHGLWTVMARLGHTYGPGISRQDERAFAEFVFAAIDGRDITLNSDGAAMRPYCYLAEAVEGLLRVLVDGEPGEAYLVANPDATCSVRELAETVASLYPERGIAVRVGGAPVPVGYVPNNDPARPVDISKMRALGWVPRIGIRTGFHRTIESFL
jgi:nucleoside-diphosphate-sugar epimerase